MTSSRRAAGRRLKQRPEFRHARRLSVACRVAVEVADGLLRYAFTLNGEGDQATLNELKRILVRVLARSSRRPRAKRA